ncbi:stage V sporulation protein AB [Anoxybacillus ayderensis]|uniref:stage V sporulation protein AB n=1 Tax=Anoxybacillus sp. ST70 TaxID=2864180 RepID=UPI0002DCCC9D|nr:stage V sporulation protein AB [Anoxybacillus sp. ST70]AXM89980.1 stage V sporulation protein AB [Anoxybacillus ayderensis G10]MBW9218074.1 stage V sporulation protein AB [Anoxybacillus sp. ST70]THD17340.1 stage V sporulation protein AB [Anoxybacillus ayderensis]
MIRELIVAFVGLAGGLAVGSGFVAFLTVLGVIPRLTQLTKTMKWITTYEWGVVLGAVVSSWVSLRDPLFSFPPMLASVIGLLSGVFVGMLAAALTEVLNVFPILAKRLGIDEQIVVLLMAMVFGKVAGSLFHWIYFVDR